MFKITPIAGPRVGSWHRFCFVLTCLVLTVGSSSASAGEFASLSVGYDRQGQVGQWIPVTASCGQLTAGQQVRLQVQCVDARGNTVIERLPTTTADAQGQVQTSGLIRTGRLDHPLRIELTDVSDDTLLCSANIRCGGSLELPEKPPPVQQFLRLYEHSVRFVLSVGNPAGLGELAEKARDLSPERPAVISVSLSEETQFPDHPAMLSLFSSVVLTGTTNLSEQQFQSLQEWVRGGGRLIYSGSDGIEQQQQTLTGQWLNHYFDVSTELRDVTDADLAALQDLVPQATRVSTFRRRVRMAQLQSDQIRKLAESTSGVLVGRTGCGTGQLTYVAVDLSQAPISRWNSLSDLYGVLLLGEPLVRESGHQRSSRISSTGISDLATQLMSSINSGPESGRWAPWQLMMIAVAWLLVIGPLDYFLVVVLLKKPHLTWITFPLWVGLMLGGVYQLRSTDTNDVLNSVHILDVTTGAGPQQARAESWMSISAARTIAAELQAVAGTGLLTETPTALSLSWEGRPEDVYDGLYRATGIGAGQQTYLRDADAPHQLTDVPLLVDGSFEARAHWTARLSKPVVTSDLSVNGFGLLEGSFSHHLQQPLQNWAVVYGKRIYRPKGAVRKQLPADQSWVFGAAPSSVSDLKTYLTGARRIRDEPVQGNNERSTYDSGAGDGLDIGTMLSLHDTAGGRSYTGLTHHTLRHLEVSDTIQASYALVIGWIDAAATELTVDGQPVAAGEHGTIVRLLLPVNRRPARQQAMSQEEVDALQENQQDAAPAADKDLPAKENSDD